MREKAIKNLTALLSSFESYFAPDERTPLEKERDNIIKRRTEYYKNKMQALAN
jgi:hypothetical protein